MGRLKRSASIVFELFVVIIKISSCSKLKHMHKMAFCDYGLKKINFKIKFELLSVYFFDLIKDKKAKKKLLIN